MVRRTKRGRFGRTDQGRGIANRPNGRHPWIDCVLLCMYRAFSLIVYHFLPLSAILFFITDGKVRTEQAIVCPLSKTTPPLCARDLRRAKKCSWKGALKKRSWDTRNKSKRPPNGLGRNSHWALEQSSFTFLFLWSTDRVIRKRRVDRGITN